MKEENKKPGDTHTQVLYLAIVVILAVLSKYWPHLRGLVLSHEVTLLFLFFFAIFASLVIGGLKLWNRYAKVAQKRSLTEEDKTSVLLGIDEEGGNAVHLKQPFRTMHAQVIGTTNAGKSESVILPWAISDIKNGSGMLIVDGKADAPFLQKLYSYVKFYGREKDFHLFSLTNPGPSSSFNPLRGSSAQEVTERVFSSFTIENEYYKSIQYKLFLGTVRLIFAQNEIPRFSLIQRLLVDKEELLRWVAACPDEALKRDMSRFSQLSDKDREERTSGLETMIGHFTSSEISELFEETDHAIILDDALEKNQILYFQLPTMYAPFLGSAVGKLVLQCFQNAVSKRQINLGDKNGKGKVLLVHLG